MRKVIIINKKVAKEITNDMRITQMKFSNNVKDFLLRLLQDPINSEPSELLKLNGLNKVNLLRHLLSKNIIFRTTKIHDKIGPAKMAIKYRIPKKDFEKNLEKLFIELFPDKSINECDGASGDGGGVISSGATSTSGAGDYQYTVPLFSDPETKDRTPGFSAETVKSNKKNKKSYKTDILRRSIKL